MEELFVAILDRKSVTSTAFIITKEGLNRDPLKCKFWLEEHVKIGHLTLPGGKVNGVEKPSVSLVRELYEELNIQLNNQAHGWNYTMLGKIRMTNAEYPIGSGNFINFNQYIFLAYTNKSARELDMKIMEPDKCVGLRTMPVNMDTIPINLNLTVFAALELYYRYYNLKFPDDIYRKIPSNIEVFMK